jgi:hypothetical protein
MNSGQLKEKQSRLPEQWFLWLKFEKNTPP